MTFQRLSSFVTFLLFIASPPLQAQLTSDQKIVDFKTLAAQFDKRYVGSLWKQTLYGVNMWNISPFLDRIAATTNDLDFYDICIDYVSQAHDGGHVFFQVPSSFLADTGLRADTYDGKPLIYAINRSLLPVAQYPIAVGDEVISIDGVPASDVMTSLMKYGTIANPRSAAASAALYMLVRPQSVIPHAVDTQATSQIVIRGPNGDTTFTIAWNRTGTPLLAEGPVASPYLRKRVPSGQSFYRRDAATDDNLTGPELLYSQARTNQATTGIGVTRPVFSLPSNFKVRLGNSSLDPFYSGTYQSGAYTIGFIRLPNFAPTVVSASSALATFQKEIAYFNENTDGLVIDEMRNPGGLIYFGEEIARRLITKPFKLIGFELRATTEWIRTYTNYITYFQNTGAPDYYANYYKAIFLDVQSAYLQGGHTGPLPLDFTAMFPLPVDPGLDQSPLLDSTGKPVGYSKPMLVLTDEFSYSTADMFPAIMQDNNAATIFGMRTGGLGGTNAQYDAGAYSEAYIGMLRGFMVRNRTVKVDGYPATSYIENVGVQPDIVEDYKTKDNLLNGGATFVTNFTTAIVNMIQKAAPGN